MVSDVMDLLERYLQAVRQFLPVATREDTIAELRANLEEQMDARAEELGRRLSDAQVADVLRAHGRPEVVAARYLPQRSLIGPGLFPIYGLTLRKGMGYVALVYAIVRGLTMLGTGAGSSPGQATVQVAVQVIVQAVLGLVPTLVYFWAIVTMVFAGIEFTQSRYGVVARNDPWDPGKLPPLKPDAGKRRSRSGRVAELVVHCVWMAFVLSLPWHPTLIMGWAVPLFRSLDVRFAPVWHLFYGFAVAVLLVQLASKLMAFSREAAPWIRALGFVRQLLDIVAFGTMVYVGEYFVPASPAANPERVAQVNQVVGLGFRVALSIAVLALMIEAWKSLRRSGSCSRMVIGAPR